MSTQALLTAYASLLVAGLAGSLHCIGMCGPILVGFSQAFERVRLSMHGQPLATRGVRARRWLTAASLEFAAYHVGRLWTYAMLGLVAGFAGQGLRTSSTWLGWQKPASIALAAAVIVSGLVLLDLLPGVRLSSWATGCAKGKLRGLGWFNALLHGRGLAPRLLLGAVMGLLPCGLVYAMLVVVAALPHPLLSALGMIAFGLGTLPALTGVLLTAQLLPSWVRAHGTRLAAVTLIVTGAWMMGRTLTASPQTGYCPFCVESSEGVR